MCAIVLRTSSAIKHGVLQTVIHKQYVGFLYSFMVSCAKRVKLHFLSSFNLGRVVQVPDACQKYFITASLLIKDKITTPWRPIDIDNMDCLCCSKSCNFCLLAMTKKSFICGVESKSLPRSKTFTKTISSWERRGEGQLPVYNGTLSLRIQQVLVNKYQLYMIKKS